MSFEARNEYVKWMNAYQTEEKRQNEEANAKIGGRRS